MYFLNALQVVQLKVIISLMLDKWLDIIYKRDGFFISTIIKQEELVKFRSINPIKRTHK